MMFYYMGTQTIDICLHISSHHERRDSVNGMFAFESSNEQFRVRSYERYRFTLEDSNGSNILIRQCAFEVTNDICLR